ncbi:hypothetical protein ABIB06_004076 [Bradyrhizobium sp. LB8.2]|uniref:hypothetical protein n=1 Tax=Bradyrhizobium sp. LB8.2 TaxID=3156330 RepID=UPI003397728C
MKFVTKLFVATAALASTSALTPAMAGGGFFDKFDPCIEQTDNFRAERASYLRDLDIKVVDADSAAVTPRYREAWMKAKRLQLRTTFDTLVAPTLKEMGVQDMEAEYGRWFDKRLDAIGAANVDKLVAVNFHQELKQVRIEQRASGEADVQSKKQDLDRSCKMDVGNQVLRGVLTTALAPIELMSRNWEIAKRESGEGAKVIAAGTGISVDAINNNGGVFGGGLSGGENSFFRKNLGIRF